MNIGILSSPPFPPKKGGIANYVYNTASKFVERGHSVTVITRGSSGKLARETMQIMNKEITIFRVPMIPIYPFHVHVHGLFVRKLVDKLSSELDVIQAHSPYVPPVAPPPPLVTTIHTLEKVDNAHYEAIGVRSLAFKVSSNIFSSVELKLFRNSDMLTAVSGHVFHELRHIYGLARNGHVVGNGVDEKTFIPHQASQGQEYVLYVGRMDYRKGLFDLLRCVKYVCEKKRNVSFILVGNGPIAGAIAKEAIKMGIRRRITFTGYVDKNRLIRLYQNAKIFVMPSLYEGLPTVILEAMACGIPVVATNIGGNIDVISHGTNGFLVPPASPEEMAKYVLMLLDNEESRTTIGRAARKTIETKYTWDKVSERILECCNSVLETERS